MTAIFPSSRPNISVRVIPKVPATMTGAGGIGVSKEDGVWTIEPSWDDLQLIAPGILLDPTSKEIWVHDPVTDVYNRMTLAGLGRALFWGTSASSVLIGSGTKTFTTQSGKDWIPGIFIQAFSDADVTNYVIGQVTAYDDTTLTINVLATGGAGTWSDWTLVPSTLPGSGPPGATGVSGGLNYNFVAGLSGDPGTGNVGFNNATIASITELRIHDVDRNTVNIAAEIATWDASTTTANRAKVRVVSADSPAQFVIVTINGAGVDGGSFTTFPVTSPVGTTLPAVGECQVEVYRTGDAGSAGAAGADGDPGAVYIGDTPPGSPFAGQEWFESDTGKMYIWYDDGSSAQWVQLIGAGGGSGSGDLLAANNLSELSASAATARANIGAVSTGGDTMLGHLVLPITPAASNAVRKDYVDAADAVVAAAFAAADATLTSNKLSKTADDTCAGAITFAKASGYAETALTYSATPTWDVSIAPVATLALTGNVTSLSASNVVAGRCYTIRIVQDTTARTVAWNSSNFKFVGGTAPTITATSGAVDRLTFMGRASNVMEEVGRAQGIA